MVSLSFPKGNEGQSHLIPKGEVGQERTREGLFPEVIEPKALFLFEGMGLPDMRKISLEIFRKSAGHAQHPGYSPSRPLREALWKLGSLD
jgi:hypothetical protein